MLRSFLAQRDPSAYTARVSVPHVIATVRAAGLVVVVITVATAQPRPSLHGGLGTGIAITLAISAAAWLVWILAQRGELIATCALIVMAASGGVLAGLSPNSPAMGVGCVAVFSAGIRLKAGPSLGVLAEVVAAFLATALANDVSAAQLLGYPWAFAGFWTVALTRREFVVRAEQAERMLAETRRARDAETHSAALAERARIARDLHDVLAHSLAAVSVNLQAAEGLLAADTLPAENPDLAKAIECIGRASTLTREGLAAARRAVLALRDDAAPLPERLASLAGEFRSAGETTVDVTVTGQVRPLPEQAILTAYRTAQEALTNARKHAPGQPVTLTLGYEPTQLTVLAVNPLPPHPAPGPLAASGAGYGLTGLAERAALAEGTLNAGPAPDGTWRVELRIPS